jgi:hypothetical protein
MVQQSSVFTLIDQFNLQPEKRLRDRSKPKERIVRTMEKPTPTTLGVLDQP